MGNYQSNSTSNNSSGQIFIKTNKSFYYPGDQVEGEILLNMIKYIPGHNLVLKIKGREQTWVNEEINPAGKHQKKRINYNFF
mmetsp:Transcript_97593/g.146234  ORF Transcript_97593/g.146234 Transcript_97593/m.146234 type:complete len:82 (+) Transcript_97593:53-298(+)